MMKHKNLFWIPLVLAFACGEPAKNTTDTATSGTITIAADEGLKPIVDAELEVFESIYPDAHIHVVYTSELEAIQLLCKDSARLAVVTRDLLPEEKALLDRAVITPRYSPFAYDGVAVIVNRKISDTIFTTDQLAKCLNGTYKTWKDLNPNSSNTAFRVVFDHPSSGIARYCKDSLLKGAALSEQCYAVETNVNVIEEVQKNENTIGLINVAWISDQDDSLMHGFTSRVRVVSMVPAHPETAEAQTMKPYQAYIGLKQYPLWRKVQLISREARVGLGTGFASFIASDKGQRIVLKSGLVPAQAPVRIIQMNSN